MKQHDEVHMKNESENTTSNQSSIRYVRTAQRPALELRHVALVHTVQKALDNWRTSRTFGRSKSIQDRGLLVGNLAMSFYAKPRFADRVEILYPEASSIPGGVDGFTRHHKGVFQEDISKTEVWTLTPKSLHIPQEVIKRIFYSEAVVHDGLMVASLESMIILKLYASDNRRLEYQALGDIARMLENNPQLSTDSFAGWGLSEFHLAKLNAIMGINPSDRDSIHEENVDRKAESETQAPSTQTRFELNEQQINNLNDWLVGVTQQAADEQVVAEKYWRPQMVNKLLGAGTFRDLSEKEEWWLSQLKNPYPRPLPYYGENGEALTYAFTPTKIGMHCRVTESITGKFIDLDDFE